MIIKLSNENFDELVSGNELTIVDFFADWCGPCKMLTSVVEEISKELPEQKIVKVNVDSFEELSSKYGIYSIPSVFAFKNGKPIDSFVGFVPKANFLRFISKNK